MNAPGGVDRLPGYRGPKATHFRRLREISFGTCAPTLPNPSPHPTIQSTIRTPVRPRTGLEGQTPIPEPTVPGATILPMAGSETPSPMPFRQVREARLPTRLPVFAHPEWVELFPWLFLGITGKGEAGLPPRDPETPTPEDRRPHPFDFRLFETEHRADALDRWADLVEELGGERIVHSRQIHGSWVHIHGNGEEYGAGGDHGTGEDAGASSGVRTDHGTAHASGDRPHGPDRVQIVADGDGHITARPDTLLAVSIADCVPIFLVDSGGRGVGLLHGGWRGIAGGILEVGIALLQEESGCGPEELFLHLGPSICGDCYEVGPEVHEALGLESPGHPSPVDLRSELGRRAASVGVPNSQVTISTFCTLCGDSPFFSHRGGESERQLALLGIRGERGAPAAWA